MPSNPLDANDPTLWATLNPELDSYTMMIEPDPGVWGAAPSMPHAPFEVAEPKPPFATESQKQEEDDADELVWNQVPLPFDSDVQPLHLFPHGHVPGGGFTQIPHHGLEYPGIIDLTAGTMTTVQYSNTWGSVLMQCPVPECHETFRGAGAWDQ